MHISFIVLYDHVLSLFLLQIATMQFAKTSIKNVYTLWGLLLPLFSFFSIIPTVSHFQIDVYNDNVSQTALRLFNFIIKNGSLIAASLRTVVASKDIVVSVCKSLIASERFFLENNSFNVLSNLENGTWCTRRHDV